MRSRSATFVVRVGTVVAGVAALGVGVLAGRGLADGPPPGASALCRDGTYSFSQTHSGTCSHHGGVAQWLDGGGAAATTTAAIPPATAKPAAVSATSCGAGFVSATIAGSHKCLHAGEFCTHAYDARYRRYGFRCTRYYANVRRYRLTTA